jgi:putative transposase
MPRQAVQERRISIKLAFEVFQVSETCYRYQPQRRAENDVIADWLIRLTENRTNWGFGLCYLYLHNVRGYRWNQKRGYRIYKELALNLRVKPK